MNRSREKITIKKEKNVLLVEGSEDKKLFKKMVEILLGKKERVQVLYYQGKGNLANFLGIIESDLRRQMVRRFGITMDADDDYIKSVEQIKEALRKQDFPVPANEIELAGQEGKTQTMFMVLPGKERTGMIEDLCVESVAQHEAMECVDKYIECLARQGHPIPVNVLPKARAHAFLASRPEPGKSLGAAAQEGYWGLQKSDAFKDVRRFIRLLAGERQRE